MPVSDGGEYLLDNAIPGAGDRLAALAAVFDPGTFRHIDALAIAEGWHCWEVGAGGSSVIAGLAARVGPTGRVLGTDIDVSWASAAMAPCVEVRRHDVTADAPPSESFDLVHARLLLVHLVERERALRTMVERLRPGGWLLVEDADPQLQPLACLEAAGREEELANRIRTGFRALMAERGVDLAYGRRLPRLLREAGLIDVEADACFPVALRACDALELRTIEVIRPRLVAAGIATEEEVERHLASVRAGGLDLSQPPMVSAWGRRRAS
ncbi:MAG: methyltransferase domain-containing protein [Acidimicrobiales bacterium]|jgi:SAM-dependent methyltransferase